MKYMLSEIARICGGELIGEDLPVARVLTDSRNCSFGEEPLFVAMKGTNHTPTPLLARWFAGM